MTPKDPAGQSPEERAEKIKSLTRNCAVSDDNELTALIAAEIRHAEYTAGEAAAMIFKITRDAEIRAAVEEAGQECSKCQRAHAKYCAECFEGEKRAAVEEESYKMQKISEMRIRQAVEEATTGMTIEKVCEVAEAKARAYEDAAKIADVFVGTDGGACANAIRARAAEVSK